MPDGAAVAGPVPHTFFHHVVCTFYVLGLRELISLYLAAR